MKFGLLLALSLVVSYSQIFTFSDYVMARIYQFHLDALIFFEGNQTKEVSSLQAIKNYAVTNPELIIILLSISQNQSAFKKVANFYGVDASKTPQLLYLSNEKKKYRFQSEDITSDNIATFVNEIKSGAVQPYFKSEPIPQTQNQKIIKVVGESFKEIVLDTEKQVLVYFYGSKCAHCLHFNPQFQQIAEKITNNSNILLAKFDATMNEVEGVEIQTLPTVTFWGKDKTSPLKYTGKHKAEQLLQWLKENTQYPCVQPSNLEQTDQNQTLNENL